MYAQIAVGGKAHLLLSYEIPAELIDLITPGQMVRVPLRDAEQLGIVVARADAAPVKDTRPINALVDPEPVVGPQYLALARWMADFYLAPLADCVWLMAPPPHVGPQHVRSVELIATPDQIEAARPSLGRPVKQADILDWLAAGDDPLPTVEQVLDAADCSTSPLRSLEKRGWVELDQEDHLRTVLPLLTAKQARAHADELRGSDIYYKILNFLAQEGAVNVDWVKAATKCRLYHLKRLASLGLLALRETEVVRDPLSDVEFVAVDPPPLTPDQAAVWAPIRQTIADHRSHATFLLHGVTGSGKTEIYLRAVAETLARGRRAIVLVPEISLTPQTTRRFLARFPDRVGLFHSQLSGGERYDTWQRARAGQLDVIIGPRSALFTPLPQLGLIVLDEEHDTSFKAQGRAPSYHSREVAIELASRAGATVILGSATPSLESYQRAQSGKYQLMTLPQRIRGHARHLDQQQKRYHVTGMKYRVEVGQAYYIPLPPVQIVDLRQELRAGNRHIFSRALQQTLRETLTRGEQAILFLNRRGHATFVLCRDCGHVLRCPHCDVPLTQHGIYRRNATRQPQLICHHCNYRIPVPSRCPACDSHRIRYFGLGTQQVEESVHQMFPGARTLRWDHDTASRRGAHELIMERFSSGQADVLVGTQMVAKGLDLPLVTLVGVISADTALNLPDFRAAERTFQLLTQVAGRAGRGLRGGRVVVQTYNPAHYAVRSAARHDYVAFAERELAFRHEQRYPPYRRLARLEYRHRKSERARGVAERLAKTLRATLTARGLPQTDLIGPAPAFFAKRRDLYRWQIILRAADPADLLRHIKIPRGWQIDVDPVSLL